MQNTTVRKTIKGLYVILSLLATCVYLFVNIGLNQAVRFMIFCAEALIMTEFAVHINSVSF